MNDNWIITVSASVPIYVTYVHTVQMFLHFYIYLQLSFTLNVVQYS
jgi:hypothetical protein